MIYHKFHRRRQNTARRQAAATAAKAVPAARRLRTRRLAVLFEVPRTRRPAVLFEAMSRRRQLLLARPTTRTSTITRRTHAPASRSPWRWRSTCAAVLCLDCQHPMVLRCNRLDSGLFFGCSRFPTHNCKSVRTFDDGLRQFRNARSGGVARSGQL